MKQIVVISGKGGTGKTTIAASFAALSNAKVIADCDVDAPDLHLLLKPKVKQTFDFKSGKKAFINEEECINCGECVEVCRFEAIEKIIENDVINKMIIDPISCEGCGVCFHICPVDAIEMRENLTGELFISESKYGTLIHAKLNVAEENSGKLVSMVRNYAKHMAEKEKKNLIIIDGPPGISCPIIASITGVDLALIVTEPTLSAMHDLDRVYKVAKHFKVRSIVCINKYDLNLENTEKIKNYCKDNNIDIAGNISFEPIVTEALVNGIPVVEYVDNKVSNEIRDLYNKTISLLHHT